jgi:hypothetical protein
MRQAVNKPIHEAGHPECQSEPIKIKICAKWLAFCHFGINGMKIESNYPDNSFYDFAPGQIPPDIACIDNDQFDILIKHVTFVRPKL